MHLFSFLFHTFLGALKYLYAHCNIRFTWGWLLFATSFLLSMSHTVLFLHMSSFLKLLLNTSHYRWNTVESLNYCMLLWRADNFYFSKQLIWQGSNSIKSPFNYIGFQMLLFHQCLRGPRHTAQFSSQLMMGWAVYTSVGHLSFTVSHLTFQVSASRESLSPETRRFLLSSPHTGGWGGPRGKEVWTQKFCHLWGLHFKSRLLSSFCLLSVSLHWHQKLLLVYFVQLL